MTRRRAVGFGILAVVLLIVVATGWGLQAIVHDSLRKAGIEQVSWEGASISPTSLELDTARFVQVESERRVGVVGEQLSLNWQWHGLSPQLTNLMLERLVIDWDGPLAQSQRTDDTCPRIELPQKVPFWLPRRVHIADLEADLPCRTGSCQLEGALQFTRAEPGSIWPLSAEASLETGGHNIQANASITDESQAGGAPDLRLKAMVSSAGDDYLVLRSRYLVEKSDQTFQLNGKLEVPNLPPASAVLDWLRQWQEVSAPDLSAQPQPDAATAAMDWSVQGRVEESRIRPVTGEVSASVHLPNPWRIANLATAEGDLALALALDQGGWRVAGAEADLRLDDPGNWIEGIPEMLRPQRLALKVTPGSDDAGTTASDQPRLPLRADLKGFGEAGFEIDANLDVTLSEPWDAQIGEARIQLIFPELNAGGWTFRGNRAELRGAGHIDADGFSLKLSPGANLQVDYVDNPDTARPFWADGLRADLANARLSGHYDLDGSSLGSLHLAGPVTIDAVRLRHDLLKTQPWHFAGDLDLDLRQITLDGMLQADSGASPDLTLTYPFGGTFSLDGSLELSGVDASQVLSGTFAHWPGQLLFESGSLNAGIGLRLGGDGPTAMDGRLGFAGLGGLYDRVSWSGLGGGLAFSLRGDTLSVQTDDLKMGQVDPGVPIKQIALDAGYRATGEQPGAGVLHLKHASARILGGQLAVELGAWAVDDRPLGMQFTFAGIEVARLLELYPAEGVAGTGELLGRVPVRIGETGVSIEGGEVRAEAPGGTLRLPAERFRAMLPDNPAMDLVADAVANFHYSVLESSVDYDQSGKLMLDLRLEGRNPDVRDGYPVVLNVNLEEDIPALLTSLQLSGQVNRAVTERVRSEVEARDTEKQR